MGVAPSELKRMTVWEFGAVADRWMEAHDTGEHGMSNSEKDEIWEWMQTQPKVPLTLKNGRADG
jgi:hypothetical protein